eukprot:CAMPEP_0203636468 /NCGR_PEP_ID=MMETSP0088-20131115/3012_1 /ASSEMBLY_ACC=CAM_ASM_001087 /TAXON_ID=426623 /ORGANISM="Chaetoceros affinis, Strain CCMP159" /LENGTH=406 /DNA_ID=CAMNT_0050490609 /DNA_START=116 /DNA_END=1336 /DNA_ORIENTATION=-
MLTDQSQNQMQSRRITATALKKSTMSTSSSKQHQPKTKRCTSKRKSLIITSTCTMLAYGCGVAIISTPSCSAFTIRSDAAPSLRNQRRKSSSKNHFIINNIDTNMNTNGHSHLSKKHNNKSYTKSTTTSIQMSSIDRDPDENNNANNLLKELQSWIITKIQQKLPPKPEDQLSLGGDIGSIFLYTFLDHAVNGFYDNYLNSPEVIQTSKSAYAAIDSSSAAAAAIGSTTPDLNFAEFTNSIIIPLGNNGNSFPVWFDAMNSAPFGSIPLSSALPIAHHIHYAPVIGEFGTAAVLLSSMWLMSGYFTRAFLFENTLECDTSRALIVTVQTWFVTSLLMFAVAYGSDVVMGSWDCLHKSVGLTRADEDYILDSLSVLLMWRFTISTFLGYGGGSDGDNDKGGKDGKDN